MKISLPVLALVSSALVLTPLLPDSVHAQNLVANGDFENDFDGWTVVEQATIDTSIVFSGAKSFKSSDPDSFAYAFIWREFPFEYSQNEITFWIYPESASYRSTFELIREWQAGTAIFNTRVGFLDDRIGFTAVDTSAVILEPLIPNQWNKVTVQVDTTTRRQDFFVNDELKASLVSKTLPPVEHLLIGDLSITAQWGTVYYDDVSITGGGLSNRPPAVVDDTLNLDIPVDGLLSGSINVLANDSDPDGDTLAVVDFETPASGQLNWQEDGQVMFELPGWSVSDSLAVDLKYTVSDGALSASGNLSIIYAGLTPVANADEFFDDGPDAKFFPLLHNDVVPPGVNVTIEIDAPPQHGTILSVEPDGVWYQKSDTLREGLDEFSYSLVAQTSSGKTEVIASVTSLLQQAYCICVTFFSGGDTALCSAGKTSTGNLDLDLIIRARDEVLGATEVGRDLLEDMVFSSPEILQLVVISEPDLQRLTIDMLDLMQDPARSFLDGDGSETITQAQMDTVQAFFDRLTAGVSDELREILEGHLAKLGPFDQYVGMTVSEAFESIGGQVGTDAEGDTPEVVLEFALEPNFPNPFNPTTILRYAVPRSSHVTIAVYDLSGREVSRLVDETVGAGRYRVHWEARDVPSGMYLVRMQSGTFSSARMVTLVR
jgi:hypothetical protein